MKFYTIITFVFILAFATQAQELAIYELHQMEQTSGRKVNFISLSDGYAYSEHPDSLIVSDAYVGYNVEKDVNYFKLDNVYRKRFLERTHISETDTVFIYNYATDSLASFNVKDLILVAILSPYESSEPYSQYDYMIGFDIITNDLKGFNNFYSHSFVYIGKENPFVKGGMQPFVWQKIDPALFPLSVEKTFGITNYVAGETFLHTGKDMDYFIQNVSDKNRFFGRYLAVMDSKTKTLLFENIFYEGESASAAPLNLVHPENGDYLMQWTGKLFKNKPPVLFGFQYESFGCAEISFIDLKAQSIYTRCDNRH